METGNRVEQLHEILIWPVRLVTPEERTKQATSSSGAGATNHDRQGVVNPSSSTSFGSSNDNLQALAALIEAGSAWKRIPDPLHHVPGAKPETEYAEFVYFHPFVRSFLYPSPELPQPDLLLMQRDDIHRVQVCYSSAQDAPLELKVLRVQLYLVSGNVAALVVELQAGPMPIQIAELTLDTLRRAYAPYWENGAPGHSPNTVQWLATDKSPLGQPANYADSVHPVKTVQSTRQPPVADHWAYLLQPLVPYCENVPPSAAVSYKQLDDERMAVLFHASFRDPFTLSDGDIIRLGMADEPGPSHSLPYAEGLLKSFFTKHAYDRYWQPQESPTYCNSRYIVMGYSFGMLGEHSNYEGHPGFFINGDTGALAHFRHHYFQMGLILQLQRAMLLTIWDRLSEIMRPTGANDESPEASAWDPAFRSQERAARTMTARPSAVEHELVAGGVRALSTGASSATAQQRRVRLEQLLDLQERFASFTARIWFTEVSSHLQARELYDLWSGHLGVRELYERIRQETDLAAGFYRSEQEKIQSEASLNLNRVAAYGLPIGILLSLGPAIAETTFSKSISVVPAILLGFGIGNLIDRYLGRKR